MGCCSSSVADQVSPNVTYEKTRPPSGKKQGNEKSGKSEIEVGGDQRELVEALPGSVISPTGKSASSAAHSLAAMPVAAAAEKKLQPTQEDHFTKANLLDATEKALDQQHLPEPKPPPPPPELVAVQATEEEMKALFHQYAKRIPPQLASALDCSWAHLEAEASIAKSRPGDPMEWYWLGAPKAGDPGGAQGLAVFRTHRGASAAHGVLCHLSLAEAQSLSEQEEAAWSTRLLGALAAVRSEMFQGSINTLRATLWYANQESGEFRVDKEVEDVFKQSGFRWFQLTNTSDGRRGQIMQLRRGEGDPPAPPEVSDLRLASCLFLPLRSSAEEAVGSKDEPKRPGNTLVLAERLRRHFLQRPEDPSSPQATAVLEGQSLQPLLQRLRDRGKRVSQVKCSDVTTPEALEEFAKECLMAGDDDSSREAKNFAASLGGSTAFPKVLCGGVALAVNWKEHYCDPADPTSIRVSVQALGLPPEGSEDPVVYLATEDEDVFCMVWQLPPDLQELGQDELYSLSHTLLKESPPDQAAEDSAAAELVLPRLQIRSYVDTALPNLTPQVEDFGRPKEMLGVQLAVRFPPKGTLRPAPKELAPAKKVLTLSSNFLLCVWHAQLDDLEVPLFALTVGPADLQGGS